MDQLTGVSIYVCDIYLTSPNNMFSSQVVRYYHYVMRPSALIQRHKVILVKFRHKKHLVRFQKRQCEVWIHMRYELRVKVMFVAHNSTLTSLGTWRFVKYVFCAVALIVLNGCQCFYIVAWCISSRQ